MRSENHTYTNHEMDILKATKGDEVRYFKNGYKCAQALNCSHVLVYNVLNPNHFAKTAKGWKLEWVSLVDIAGQEKMAEATESYLYDTYNQL